EELKLSSTRICKDPTVLCVKTTLATAKFLNAIALPRYLMLNKAFEMGHFIERRNFYSDPNKLQCPFYDFEVKYLYHRFYDCTRIQK
ncbi:hypothetical protein BB561_000960, partial [Smittium simulii]